MLDYLKMLIELAFLVAAGIVVLISFAIGYGKYRFQRHGPGSLVLLSLIFGLMTWVLWQIPGLVWWQALVVAAIGIVFFFFGDCCAFWVSEWKRQREEKAKKAKEDKRRAREAMPIIERLLETIRALSYVEILSITPATPMSSIYEGFDLGGITGATELAVVLEDEFGFETSDEIADSWITIGDVIRYIEQQLAEPSPPRPKQ